MFKKRTTLISLRYILLLVNFIQLLTIMLSPKEQLLETSLPYIYTKENQDSVHHSLIVNISLSMTFLICEFLTFGFGFTMFSNICTLLCKTILRLTFFILVVAIFGHLISNIFLIYFLNGELDITLLWWIFPFTYCLPLFSDIVTTIGTLCFEGIKYK